jgi:hypothetical protein
MFTPLTLWQGVDTEIHAQGLFEHLRNRQPECQSTPSCLLPEPTVHLDQHVRFSRARLHRVTRLYGRLWWMSRNQVALLLALIGVTLILWAAPHWTWTDVQRTWSW